MHRLTIVFAAGMAFFSHAPDIARAEDPPQTTAVLCGHLIDPARSTKVLGAHVIVVENGKIKSVTEGAAAPDGVSVTIDLGAAYCLPGLIDAHTHLTSEYGPDSFITPFTRSAPDIAFRSLKYANATLMAGFTTVRDAGAGDGVDLALRDAIARGDVIGPRMFVAGTAISITGGHGDRTGAYRDDRVVQPGVSEGIADGVPDVTEAVRRQIKRGANHIKFMASGGVLSQADNASSPQYTQEEMNAIVGTARDHGLKAMAHAHGDEGARRAILAGVASIEHGTFISDDTFALMKRTGTYLVPTIIAGMSVTENAKIEGFYPPAVAAKALEVGPKIKGAFSRALKQGVKIAFGTDAGVFLHGTNAREFQYMVDGGMTPIQAIAAATVGAADLLGHGNTIGTIAPGKYADLIAVSSDPTIDISVMMKVAFVMKEGKVYKSE